MLRRAWLAGLAVVALVVAVVVLARPGPFRADTAGRSDTVPSVGPGESVGTPAAGRPSSITAPPSPGDPRDAFAEAYRSLAEDHDREVTDLLIANPLSEFDLVGTRLIERLGRTREQLAGLPPLAETDGRVRELETGIDATLAALNAVDPHGPRAERDADYQEALDAWVAGVQPISDEIRAMVGLPPSTTGDLRL